MRTLTVKEWRMKHGIAETTNDSQTGGDEMDYRNTYGIPIRHWTETAEQFAERRELRELPTIEVPEIELVVRVRVRAVAEHQARMRVIAALRDTVEAMAFQEEYAGLDG